MSEEMNCKYCGKEIGIRAAVCPECGAALAVPGGKLLTKSRALDTTLAAFGTFLVGAGLLAGGLALTTTTDRVWPLFAAFGLSLALGLAAIFILKPTHRALMLGVVIGLCVALLNPLSLCLGIIGLTGLGGR